MSQEEEQKFVTDNKKRMRESLSEEQSTMTAEEESMSEGGPQEKLEEKETTEEREAHLKKAREEHRPRGCRRPQRTSCRILGLTALNSLLQYVNWLVWEVCSVN